MKNIIKSVCFFVIFVLLLIVMNVFFMPSYNLKEYGVLDVTTYEILEEKKDTIDALFVGDSLVYSAVSPMEIWNNYGYTSFDCSTPAQLTSTSYEYIKRAIDSQHPNVVFLEANVLFRDAKKRSNERKWDDFANKYLFMLDYHDNWKRVFFGKDIININKGYVFINKVNKADVSSNYMGKPADNVYIPKENSDYFEKIIKLCEDNNVTLVLFSIPSMKSWNITKDEMVMELAQEKGLDYIDLNKDNPLGINWLEETKDEGSHLNYWGAKKVSLYLGEYMKDHNFGIDYRNDKDYESWNESYKVYSRQTDQ